MRSLVAALNELCPNNNFCFIQDSAPSHGVNIIQNFLLFLLKSRFASNTKWPPSSPDCNLLDHYFWHEVEEKVYSGHDAFWEWKWVERQKNCVRPMCYKCWTTSQSKVTVFTTLKRCLYKRRKTDQGRVWLNFVLLLSKFISKGEFSTAM